MEPEEGETADYAEVYSSVVCRATGQRIRKRINYSGPTLIIDMLHVFPGEPVPIKGLPDVLRRDKGIYRVILFESENVENTSET